MKVLVTGHRGYIGVEMVPFLRKQGHEVFGLDVGFYDESDFESPPDEVPTVDADLRDVKPQHLKGFDGIIHLAALSNDPVSDLNPKLTYDINHQASVNLARAAKEAGVPRFVFASSCSLYGAGGDKPLDENAEFNPVTPYGESKVKSEMDIGPLADSKFCPVYCRNATAYGVSRRLRADIVVNSLVGHAITTGKVMMQSDGTPWRPLVHIEDIMRGAHAALTAPADAVRNQAFNIGRSKENFRIREVAQMVAEVVPNCELSFAEGASPDLRNYRVDFTKAETKLPGFDPQWTLKKGIEQLYAAYKHHGMTKDEWQGPKYYRLKVIKGLLDSKRLNAQLRWQKK